MKLLLRILLLFVFGLKLKAQVVSVHCDYDFQNHMAGKNDDLFFVTHIKSGLDSDFFQIQLDMAARKILNATNSGEPINKIIPFYQPAKLYSKDIALSDFVRWKQAEFNEPASSALNSNHYSSYVKVPFVKDGAAAVCDRDLRIEPGGKYFFGFDTVFTNRKKKQFKLVPHPVNVSGVIPFFSEEWYFDKKACCVRKKVRYVSFLFDVIDTTKEPILRQAGFAIHLN